MKRFGLRSREDLRAWWVVVASCMLTACGSDDRTGAQTPGDTGTQDTKVYGEACPTPNAKRDCSRSNDFGTCKGQESCINGYWQGCDAKAAEKEVCNGVDDNCNGDVDEGIPTVGQACTLSGSSKCGAVYQCKGSAGIQCVPKEEAVEICDYQDNNCDGLVDEAFRDKDGLYTSDKHCGACNNDCSKAFAGASKASCQVSNGIPKCVATECMPGSTLQPGGLGCVALKSNLCGTCTADADCATTLGDKCVDYGSGQKFCGRDCSSNSVFGTTCPAGFECASGQCRIANGGSCSCGPTDNFTTSCIFNSPTISGLTCQGSRTCAAGVFASCTPPKEICNGLDDDCNGIVDDGFVNAVTKKYDGDKNCGACGIDCTVLFSDASFNAVGVCSASGGEVPSCIAQCKTGYKNTTGNLKDGCNCKIIQPDTDMPDVNGVDEDCDGIDGQIKRGIFVSPSGNDNNPGTKTSPVRTITRGIALSQASLSLAQPLDHVYVAEGVYEESVDMKAGTSVYGSYSPDFSKHTPKANTSIILGAVPTAAKLGAVNFVGVKGKVSRLDGMLVRASSSPSPSGNSYAVYIRDSDGGSAGSQVYYSRIVGGTAQSGSSGGKGADGANATSVASAGGSAKSANAKYCSAITTAGGSGASFSCGGIATHGGTGGTASCPVANLLSAGTNTQQGSGSSGQGPTGLGGTGGGGGYNGIIIDYFSPRSCPVLVPQSPPVPSGGTEVGLPGTSGKNGSNGSSGSACLSGRGSVVANEWVSPSATAGQAGSAGGGGGGGGAGGGVTHDASNSLYVCTLSPANTYYSAVGASGGGGGAGGCGGGGGSSGQSGGGSFAIFATYGTPPTALPVFEQNTIERGSGGAGGSGGVGGNAGQGGTGASGGTALAQGTGVTSYQSFARVGGRGGDGGRGGFGGGGAGGCGGASVGVFFDGIGTLSTSPVATNNTFPATGSAGSGGNGGPSLGNTGPVGAPGLYTAVSP